METYSAMMSDVEGVGRREGEVRARRRFARHQTKTKITSRKAPVDKLLSTPFTAKEVSVRIERSRVRGRVARPRGT